jgi:hypothetical protein
MTKLAWDQSGDKLYETGVDKGVLYPQDTGDGSYPLGYVWNGLTAVTESPSGAAATPIYADNGKYLNLISAEEFAATIEAYTYPDEFAQCDGSAEIATGIVVNQQTRKPFGLAYRTVLGNDLDGNDYGYKLHLIYGALAAPSEKGFKTINDTPDAITFSWVVATTPVSVGGLKPTASLDVDSTKVDPTLLATLEGILFGTDGANARLPLPDEIATLFAGAAPDAIALSTIAPADDSSGALVTANIVLTFNNKIAHEAIVVASAGGTLIAGAKTWDTAKKVLTFNPTTNLDPSTTYLVTVAGVIDIYGHSLTTVIKNFETAGA